MLKIKKIYHLSDIHIRNFKRHAEYNRVFQRVADYIKETKTEESIICITGDVVHSKTDITPELVQEVQGFFRLMSSLLPVVIIPGNHDANLNNNDRLDSLSPIINAMADANITYLRDTGVYRIGGVDFVHWSVFDSIGSYIKASDVESEYKICLYHGVVNGAYTDLGFELTGNSVSPSDFEGFDLALLGDIHIAAQFMNSKKTAAYPGSLIQQDHGESLDHGLLVWDLPSRSAEFVPIENDTAFYTLEVENGLYQEIPEEVPVNLYLKVKAKNTSPAQIKNVVAEIKANRNVLELSQQMVRDQSAIVTEIENGSHSVRDVSYQNRLLSDYLTQKFDLPEDDIKNVCDLNSEINKGLVSTDFVRNVQWSPKRFAFSNMFSYGKGNVIDFEGMNGSYGMFAKNASGKSSAIEALVYCLFDKSSKTGKAGMVMNNRSREFDCRFDFELNDKTYTIERKASYRGSSDAVKQDVSFYYTDKEGTVVSLNGKDRADTNASIRSVIGTYDDFVLSSMSMQNNNTGFIDMGQTERKDLLSQFLDIKVFEDLNKIASENIKEYSTLIKEYKKVDHFEKLKESEEKAKAHAVQYRQLEKEKTDLERGIENKREAHAKLTTKLVQVNPKILNLDLLESQKESIKAQKTKLKDDLKAKRDLLDKSKTELSDLQVKAQVIDSESYDKLKTELQSLTDREKQMSIQVETLKTQLFNKLEKMKRLEDLKYDENCKFCMDNVFVKDAIATRDSIESDKVEAKSVADNLKHLRQSIETLKKTVADQDELYDQVNKKQNEVIRLESGINRDTLELHQKDAALKDVEDYIDQYKKKEDAIKSNRETDRQLQTIQSAIDSLNAELRNVLADLMRCNSDIQLAHKEVESAKQSIENLKAVEEKYKYYEYYLSATGRDGLPYNLISAVIPKVQTEINNILSQIVDFSISVESDGKNINAYIVYDDTKKWPIELASGMEKFISSLAIRSALINMTSLPRPNFLVIDEGWGALDKENLQNVSVLMEYLKTQFKFVIIISHIDSIKDIVDHQISIDKKKDGFSKVVHR